MLSDWAIQLAYNRQQAILDTVESPLRREIYREKKRFINAVEAEYDPARGIPNHLFADHERNMVEILRNSSAKVMARMAAEVELHASSPIGMRPKKSDAAIDMFFRQWFALFGAQRAKDTASTTRDDLRRELLRSQDETGGEIPLLQRFLRARGIAAFRADTIARTETHNAAMAASTNTADRMQDETGLVILKQWVPVQDGRTRDAHAAMSGSRPIPMSAKFLVNGEYLDHPGQGSPGNAINCRCVLVYEPQ